MVTEAGKPSIIITTLPSAFRKKQGLKGWRRPEKEKDAAILQPEVGLGKSATKKCRYQFRAKPQASERNCVQRTTSPNACVLRKEVKVPRNHDIERNKTKRNKTKPNNTKQNEKNNTHTKTCKERHNKRSRLYTEPCLLISCLCTPYHTSPVLEPAPVSESLVPNMIPAFDAVSSGSTCVDGGGEKAWPRHWSNFHENLRHRSHSLDIFHGRKFLQVIYVVRT